MSAKRILALMHEGERRPPTPAELELLHERWLYRVLATKDLADYALWCAQRGRTERARAALRGVQDAAEAALGCHREGRGPGEGES